MKRKLAVMLVIATCSTIFAACGNTEKSQMEELQRRLNDSNARIEQLEKKLNEIYASTSFDNQEGKKIEKKLNEIRLINISKNNYEKILTEKIITIDYKETLYENAKKVIEATMKNFFENRKYQISFKKEGKDTIVVLDLMDEDGHKDWYNAFQGSTGGYVNSKIIIENILQREYKGEWISGLKVLYNGKDAEFQHAPDLQNVIYR